MTGRVQACSTLLARQFGVARRHVEAGQRFGDVGDRVGPFTHQGREAVEHLGFERQNPVGGPRDLRFEFAEFDAGEAHRVDHGLAMHEVLHQALEAGLAHRLRHLDVVAEHVVVLDPERPAAGGFGVARLERGDDLSRILAEQPGLVDLGVVARAHEIAVAAVERQVVGERPGQFVRESPVGPVEAAGEAGEAVRQILPRQARAEGRGGGEPVAQGGEIARAGAVQADAGERAGDVGGGA